MEVPSNMQEMQSQNSTQQQGMMHDPFREQAPPAQGINRPESMPPSGPMQQYPQGQPPQDPFADIAMMVSDVDRRLRVLEERYSILRKKLQLTDQNVLESERSFGKEVRQMSDTILEMKRTMHEFDEKTMQFSGELQQTAKKNDVKVIEKYLSLWNPSTFVTRSELKRYTDKNADDTQESDTSLNESDDSA